MGNDKKIEPFIKREPGNLITAQDWNEMQTTIRQFLNDHAHSGAPDQGAILTGDAFDQKTPLSIKKLQVDKTLAIGKKPGGFRAEGEKVALSVDGAIRTSDNIFKDVTGLKDVSEAGWYRIAEGTGDSAGIFELRWAATARHGHVRFSVGASHGDHAGVQLKVIEQSSGGEKVVERVRLLTKDKDADGNPSPHYIEFYFNGAVHEENPIPFTVYQLSGYGWTLLAPVVAETAEGYVAHELRADVLFAVKSGDGRHPDRPEHGSFVVHTDGTMARRIAVATGLGPTDETSDGQIVTRVLTFSKIHKDTAVRILYCDNFRVLKKAGGAAATWEIRIDGEPAPGGGIYQDKHANANHNHHDFGGILGYAFDLEAGAHTIGVWVHPKGNYGGTSACTGWDHSRWTIEAEEVWIDTGEKAPEK